MLGPLKRLRSEQMLETYQTSVLDAFTLIQAILPKLAGSIVLFSSVAARTGLPNHCAISAAKSGLEGFGIALAAELAPGRPIDEIEHQPRQTSSSECARIRRREDTSVTQPSHRGSF